MKNKKGFVVMVALLLATITHAQAPTAMINAGDVDRFIKTAIPMSKELEAMGLEFSEEEMNNPMEAIAANAKAMAVVKKYGWDGTIAVKWMAITMCYTKIKMDEQLAMLPQDQRKMMADMMAQSTAYMMQYVNEADLKLVKARVKDLDVMMNSEN